MNAEPVVEPTPRWRATIESEGTRKVFRKGAADEGPVPIDDEELEAVAGGGSYRVEFTDGCVVTVTGVDNALSAGFAAEDTHSSWMGHENHGYTVTSL